MTTPDHEAILWLLRSEDFDGDLPPLRQPAAAIPQPGALVDDRYRLVDQIGAGGAGRVFRAREVATDRLVAVKVLAAAHGASRARFQREAEATASLRHPHVVRIHAVGTHGELDYLVLELIEEARPLDDAWEDRPLPARLDLLAQVASGLAAAHAQGIVHRDLKPSNVLVRPDGQAVVCDFGLARVAQSDLTKTGQFLGTPTHMAPEQVAGARATPATDVWALGVLLYQALYDTHPFGAAQTVQELFGAIRHGQIDFPHGPPSALIELARRSLAVSPAQRPADAAAFQAALTAARRPANRWGAGLLALTALAALTLTASVLWAFAQPTGGGPPQSPRAVAPTTPPSPADEEDASRPLPVVQHELALRELLVVGQTLVALGETRACWLDLAAPTPTLRELPRPFPVALAGPEGPWLVGSEGSVLLRPDGTLEPAGPDWILDADPETGESLWWTHEALEVRRGGETCERYAVSGEGPVTVAALRPGAIAYARRDAGERMCPYALERPQGETRVIKELFGTPFRTLFRVGDELYGTPGEGVLLQFGPDLTPSRELRGAGSGVRVSAHLGSVGGVFRLGDVLLSWSSVEPATGVPGELLLWDRRTGALLDARRDLPLRALWVTPDGLLALGYPRHLVLTQLDGPPQLADLPGPP